MGTRDWANGSSAALPAVYYKPATCAVCCRIEGELCLAQPLRRKQIVVLVLALAAVASDAIGAEIAWNDTINLKGCDGNSYRIQRPRNLRQCLEGASQLRCTSKEMQQRCWHHYGQQQNGQSGQPPRY